MNMRRSLLVLVACCLFSTGFTGGAAAESEQWKYSISPLLGGYMFEGNQDLEDAMTFGVGLGYGLTKNWGTELFFNYIDSESEVGSKDAVEGYLYHVDALYHFMPETKLVPYLAAGLGGITLDPDDGGNSNDLLLNYGGGLKYYLQDNLALRGDVRHIVTVDDSENNLIYSVGLTFLFGGSASVPVQAQAVATFVDSDKDGVEDKKDRCPDTPAGLAVDGKGCPPDTDKDGVPDYRDKCPHSSKGVMVDDDGCVLKYTLHIEFDFDKADIRPIYHDQLLEAAEFIKHYKAPQILVAGHTDEIGSAEYNQKLSERRAASVSKYLHENFGISKDRLAERGYGKTKPLTDDQSEEGHQKNRRVEIICCTIIWQR